MEIELVKKQISLFNKAYLTIEEGFKNEDFNDLEKDGIIQRFEYTIEIAWKTCKKVLEYQKLNFIASPKEILKECYKLSIITDLELWENFLDIRNSMSHMYSEYVSSESFNYIQKHFTEIKKLIDNLNSLVK